MSPHDLVAAIRDADSRHGLFALDERVIVAVSGGPDSVAMLDALHRFAPERGLRLHVAHLDHALRPESADESAFVGRLADGMGLPVSSGVRDVASRAADSGRSLEEAARSVRYAFLAAVAADVGATCVAVGHQADDQAETVLMNFIRGSGLDGLKGMTPVASWPLALAEIATLEDLDPGGIAAEGGTASPVWPPRLVRPLLAVRRYAIEGYLAARRILALEDPSNQDLTYLRNRLRHQVGPMLAEINPRLVETLLRNAAAVAEDVALLERLTDEAWSRCVVDDTGREGLGAGQDRTKRVRFRRSAWLAEPTALQARLLRRAAERLGALRGLGWEHVAAVRRSLIEGLDGPGLPGGLTLVLSMEEDGFALGLPGSPIPLPRLSTDEERLEVPGETGLPGGWCIHATLRDRRPDDPPVQHDAWTEALDADVVGASPAVRGRRLGDRFRPLGMGGHGKSIQDLFVDLRVPRTERDGWPLVVSSIGEILWAVGLRLAETARIAPSTKRVVVLRATPPARLRSTRRTGSPTGGPP